MAATPDLRHTVPPQDAVMPVFGEQLTTAIFGGMAALLIVYALLLAIRRRSWLPIVFLVAAQAGLLLEGLGDVMGNAIYPPVGQWNAFVIKGHPVPMFVVFVYIWYLGATPILMYDAFVKQSMSYAGWWKYIAINAVCVAAVEQIPVHYGIWIYYGTHPFMLGEMPIWMIAANILCILFPALIVYRLMPILSGWRQLLPIALVPAAAAGGHAAAGIPMYNVLGAQTETVAPWVLQFGSIATLIFAGVLVWVALGLMYERFPRLAATRAGETKPPNPASLKTQRAGA